MAAGVGVGAGLAAGVGWTAGVGVGLRAGVAREISENVARISVRLSSGDSTDGGGGGVGSFEQKRPGQVGEVQKGFVPALRPSHPPHSWQVSGSLAISANICWWRCAIVLRHLGDSAFGFVDTQNRVFNLGSSAFRRLRCLCYRYTELGLSTITPPAYSYSHGQSRCLAC